MLGKWQDLMKNNQKSKWRPEMVPEFENHKWFSSWSGYKFLHESCERCAVLRTKRTENTRCRGTGMLDPY